MAIESIESPLDDLTYDLVTILHEKAKALRAYAEYLRDAEEDDEVHELLTELRRQDEENIRALKELVARRLDEDLGYIEEEEEGDEELEAYADEDESVGDDREELDEAGESRGESGTPTSRSAGVPPARGESTHRRT